jgi:hypothetical protein
MYGAIAAGTALVVILAFVLEPSGGVSLSNVQDLIKTTYNTSAVTCVASSHGHDLCKVATDKCRGSLLVHPVDSEIYTVVAATPESLRSEESCSNPETLTPQ